MKQLEEIKARASAATAGPWDFGTGYSKDGERQSTSKPDKAHFLALSLNDDETPLWVIDNAKSIPAVTGDGPNSRANAAFIAAARTDVPKLVAALEAVWVLADEHDAECQRIGDLSWVPPGRIRSIITEALGAE